MKRQLGAGWKLSSKDPFSYGLLIFMTVPTSLSIPLSEAAFAAVPLQVAFINSLSSTALGILVILALKPLYRSRWKNAALTPLIALSGGITKGVSVWLLAENSGQQQNELWVRVLLSSLTWLMALTVAAYFKEHVLETLSVNRKLRLQIAKARKRHGSLDQQLAWLKQAQLQGLSSELATQLVRITKRLNDQGFGPAAYQDLAAELRDASRQQVRAKSKAVWKTPESSAPERILEILRTAPGPLLVALLFFLSAGLNTIRTGGLGAEFLIVLLTSAAIFGWLWISRNSSWLQNLTFLAALASNWLLRVLPEPGNTSGFEQALSAALWAQLLVILASFWKVSTLRDKDLTQNLSQQLSQAQSEAEWLALQLESQNLEIAKYLHAILQTRLMAYAMRLEGTGLTKTQLGELTELLANPLGEFQPASNSLNESLQKLQAQWEPIVIVHFTTPEKANFANLDTPTVQIIQEAVANSVRHGLADQIWITVKDDGFRKVSIEDNGIGPRTGEPGLGSEVFDSLSAEWSLERAESGGARLQATI